MSDQTAQPESTAGARGQGGMGGRAVPPFGGSPGGRPPGVSTILSRRGLLRAAGAGAAVVGGGGLLDACSSSIKGASSGGSTNSTGTTKDISIAFIHPLTGALADFGTSDNWIVSEISATSQYKAGITTGGKTYKFNITSYDTQSDPTRAGQLAQQVAGTADLILTSSTPETVVPVATTAEKLGVP